MMVCDIPNLPPERVREVGVHFARQSSGCVENLSAKALPLPTALLAHATKKHHVVHAERVIRQGFVTAADGDGCLLTGLG